MASRKKNPRQVQAGVPFHAMLYRLRRDVELPTVLAVQAGITTSDYLAVELGRLPCSQALYDVVVARFPQLKSFARPGPDPSVLQPTQHSAVSHEYQRIDAFLTTVKQINIGHTNRNLMADICDMCIRGEVTTEDVRRFLRA